MYALYDNGGRHMYFKSEKSHAISFYIYDIASKIYIFLMEDRRYGTNNQLDI